MLLETSQIEKRLAIIQLSRVGKYRFGIAAARCVIRIPVDSAKRKAQSVARISLSLSLGLAFLS